MVQKVETRFVDDIDGSEAVETICFAVDGREYEIDLSQENASRLRESVSAFIGSARPVGRARKPARSDGARRSSLDREQQAGAVKTRARKNGDENSDRGRTSGGVFAAFDQRATDVAAAGGERDTKRRPPVTDPFALPDGSELTG